SEVIEMSAQSAAQAKPAALGSSARAALPAAGRQTAMLATRRLEPVKAAASIAAKPRAATTRSAEAAAHPRAAAHAEKGAAPALATSPARSTRASATVADDDWESF